ncbi:hypothetical protein V7182_24700 [Neobacillus drentensis]|uniref:hypothetical protein n=1 Tax=Neobacillus drentensis TaxID=220684 RepID=UPI003000612D
MNKSYKTIDSEKFNYIEQEIYSCIVNHSNKNKVILKLKELKTLSEDDLRAMMPWGLIDKEIGYRQKFFLLIRMYFAELKGLFSWNKYIGKNDSLELLKPNSEKAYNLTYKYYAKSVFDGINSDINSILEKHKFSYVYLYPHELSLEENEEAQYTYSSKETKNWEKKTKILDLFKIAIWIITFGLTIEYIFKIDLLGLWGKILVGLTLVSAQVIYKIVRYYFNVRKILSGYKDTLVIETKNHINIDLQAETATCNMLEAFYDSVVKSLKERKTKTHKYLKITAIVFSVIFVIFTIYNSFNNNQGTNKLTTNQTNSDTLIKKSNAQKEDVEKYLQKKGMVPLLLNEPMPDKEIEFDKENITGKISRVSMSLFLDCNSIKVKTIDEKRNIIIEAYINPKITAKEWEIKGIWPWRDRNKNKTLKENYKDRLDDEILERYHNNKSEISTSNEIKKRAEDLAKIEIESFIKNRYSDINGKYEIMIKFKSIEFDVKSTNLK